MNNNINIYKYIYTYIYLYNKFSNNIIYKNKRIFK